VRGVVGDEHVTEAIETYLVGRREKLTAGRNGRCGSRAGSLDLPDVLKA